MRGNQFGKLFSLTTFGESHGEALGVVIDGVPAGLTVSKEALQQDLLRRAPGQNEWTTSRKESDECEVLSGVFDGKTLGTPIAVIVRNTNQRSQDYDKLKNDYRPGHADKTTMLKYGFRDHRGGGRSSGRETLARVIAGYFASLIVPEIQVKAAINQIAHIKAENTDNFFTTEIGKTNFLEQSKEQELINFLMDCKSKGESAGGSILLGIRNCPAGLGEPVFDKLKADLAKAMLSIGSCTGFTYGRGVDFAALLGTEISEQASNFGGMEGGISNGDDLYMTLYFKAPSTVGEKAKEGRHDPCILPRVIPVVEAMAKVVIADHLLRQKSYQISE
jgi:chorismate synthase